MILRYHALARMEIIETAEHYALERPELGSEFLADLDTAIGMILANPVMFEQVRPGMRRCLMKRCAYGIYYRTPDENTVRIIIVRHHSRRPGLGMRRK